MNKFLCRKCGKTFESKNTKGARCNCGHYTILVIQKCAHCEEYKFISSTAKVCRECSNIARGEKMRGRKGHINCNKHGNWDVPFHATFGKVPDVAKAIKSTWFVNSELAGRYIEEAVTYEDIQRIRNEYELDKMKGKTFGVANYG